MTLWLGWVGFGFVPQTEVDLAQMLNPVSWQHLLGTDALGRDLLLRLSEAIIGTVPWLWGAVILGSGLGLALSSLRLSVSGKCKFTWLPFDGLAMTLVALPALLMVFSAMIILDVYGLSSLLCSLSLISFLRFYCLCLRDYQESCRLGYWQAHEALGGSAKRQIWRYGVLGRWRPGLTDELLHLMRFVILAEMALSYLGFGVQEPKASLGNILASHYDLFLKGQWALGFATFAVIYLVYAMPLVYWQLARQIPKLLPRSLLLITQH